MKIINDCLQEFRGCFSRAATFHWFLILVVAMVIRDDHLGITAVIRELLLNEKHYPSLVHFFHSTAWDLDALNDKWIKIVHKIAPLFAVLGDIIYVGDGVKAAKEARHMPGNKKQHQESETQSTPSFFFGHHFGGVGILIGNAKKIFCLPVSLRITDGIRPIAEWMNDNVRQQSHVVQVIHQTYHVASIIKKKGKILLDRYFLTKPAIEAWKELSKEHGNLLHIVTKAKRSCVAFTDPPPRTGKPGRPRKRGERIKLFELFTDENITFNNATLWLYGVKEEVSYYTMDLLWKEGFYHKLRFVLVSYSNKKSILVSTDLNAKATTIIELYAKRTNIECMFRAMKQTMAGFFYHFWTKAMPRLNLYQKKDASHPLESVTSKKQQLLIIKKLKAIEGYVLLSSIALGLLQIISLKLGTGINLKKIRFLRTYSSDYGSEATMREYLRKSIFMEFAKSDALPIIRIIKSKQRRDFFSEDTQNSDIAA